jgi:hypothetical protein
MLLSAAAAVAATCRAAPGDAAADGKADPRCSLLGIWDHGECRNGGHPDWVLDGETCGELRSTDPKYLSCVTGWYTALAAQLMGLYHKDGGPITMVQVRSKVFGARFELDFSSI